MHEGKIAKTNLVSPAYFASFLKFDYINEECNKAVKELNDFTKGM